MSYFGFLSLLLSVVLSGCGRGYHDVGRDKNIQKPKVVTYAWLEEVVFKPNCISCHGENDYKTKGGSFALYNYDLYMMEADTVWSEIAKDSMPKEGAKLTPKEKSWVKEWIDTGMTR
jgi:hypothetical protein